MAEKEIPLKEIGIDEVRKICEKQGLKPEEAEALKGCSLREKKAQTRKRFFGNNKTLSVLTLFYGYA